MVCASQNYGCKYLEKWVPGLGVDERNFEAMGRQKTRQ